MSVNSDGVNQLISQAELYYNIIITTQLANASIISYFNYYHVINRGVCNSFN
jgi:hypothetical protein